MKQILIFVSLVLFFSESCRKDEKELTLPPYTHDGRNVLACKINGNIFIAEGKQDAFSSNDGISYYNFDDSLTHIHSESETPFDAEVNLRFIHSKGKTSFKLTNQEKNSADVDINDANHSIEQAIYRTNKENTGNVNITYYQNNIIAGNFEFDAVPGYGDTIHVTEGIFDISTQ